MKKLLLLLILPLLFACGSDDITDIDLIGKWEPYSAKTNDTGQEFGIAGLIKIYRDGDMIKHETSLGEGPEYPSLEKSVGIIIDQVLYRKDAINKDPYSPDVAVFYLSLKNDILTAKGSAYTFKAKRK